jgi:NAD(P)-dependent dehydrogenase (short-subunit alcohol dehydrogenase family)
MITGMQLKDKVAVITGGAHGIGEGLARRFKAEGARGIVVADLDGAGAERVAKEIGGVGVKVDVAKEAEIQKLVSETTARFGQIDLFCSNAGIFVPADIDVSDAEFARMRDIHVLAHLYAARAVMPQMLERGDGYLLQTVSAAGLITSLESMTYAITKHAALALAEWISMTYGDRGIKVSALCPQGVRTAMLMQDPDNYLVEGSVSVEQVADAVIEGIAQERFLILPHPEAAEYFRRKSADYDRWLRGMRRFRGEVEAKRKTLATNTHE